jgi:uncharacterized protein YecE (DUF72 family)
MEFGRLQDISQVDFTLPPDHPATAGALLALPSRTAPPQLYAGCTGWSMKEWVGSWYPPGTRPTGYLAQYGLQFGTIELNTTHYRIPRPEQVVQWRGAVPPSFRFCPKIPQRISHSADLGLSSGQIPEFAASMACFEENLGPSFLQLPPGFGPDRWARLERFFRAFPVREVPLAVEFRHPDWFGTSAGDEAFALMAESGISAVITDVAGHREVLHQRLTTGSVLIRFVGNALHPTDLQRLDDWTERLSQWFSQGLREAYLFLHEPDNVQAPELAARWIPRAVERLGVRTQVPRRHTLGTLFDLG